MRKNGEAGRPNSYPSRPSGMCWLWHFPQPAAHGKLHPHPLPGVRILTSPTPTPCPGPGKRELGGCVKTEKGFLTRTTLFSIPSCPRYPGLNRWFEPFLRSRFGKKAEEGRSWKQNWKNPFPNFSLRATFKFSVLPLPLTYAPYAGLEWEETGRHPKIRETMGGGGAGGHAFTEHAWVQSAPRPPSALLGSFQCLLEPCGGLS